MSARRWAMDRMRREIVAASDPIKFSREIVRRVVVIDRETTVREAVIYAFDSQREANRKLRRVMQAA